jgi:hypothetical protein
VNEQVNPIFKDILDNVWLQPVNLANILENHKGERDDTRNISKDTEGTESPKESV